MANSKVKEISLLGYYMPFFHKGFSTAVRMHIFQCFCEVQMRLDLTVVLEFPLTVELKINHHKKVSLILPNLPAIHSF